MCVNYRPATPAQLEEVFGAVNFQGTLSYPSESFPAYLAPMLVASKASANEAKPALLAVNACFGLIPAWAKDTKFARHTYNARSETVAEKPAFRKAWQAAQRCLIPMQAFYEPRYDEQRAERWRIEQQDKTCFAVAGLWDQWRSAQGERVFSFTMLTLNADEHSLMKQFHKPGEEKRSIAVLTSDHWREWFDASPNEAGKLLRGPNEGLFRAEADPLLKTAT